MRMGPRRAGREPHIWDKMAVMTADAETVALLGAGY